MDITKQKEIHLKAANLLGEVESLDRIVHLINDNQFSIRFGEVTFMTYFQCGPVVSIDFPEIHAVSPELRKAFTDVFVKMRDEVVQKTISLQLEAVENNG